MILIPVVSVEDTLVTVVTVLSVGVDAVVCDTVAVSYTHLTLPTVLRV